MKIGRLKNKNGITLIALIITIIVMLILAGIVLILTISENGIMTRAEEAGIEYSRKEAREKLELVLLDMQADKVVNSQYDENEYLTGKIEENGMIVNEDIVIVNGWSFEIDRSVPKISKVLEKSDYDYFKVNRPKVADTGLIPVTINADGSLNEVSSYSTDWYAYNETERKWANAKTKDGSMFVWIPRYAYKINADQSIDVVFLKGTSNNYVEDGKVKDALANGYIVHPAFEDGSKTGYPNGEWRTKLTGFWMAKFEAGYEDADKAIDSDVGYSTIYSYDGIKNINTNLTTNYYGTRAVETKIKYPVFKANKPSMNYIGISDSFDLAKSLTNHNNPYGLRNIDSHLTKNSEWGAVAYLTQSKYGRNKEEVTINNITVNGEKTVYAVTGYAGENISDDQIITTLTTINNGEVPRRWISSQGQNASSTKNIYGIYDLSGGSWEWTAGYIAQGDYYNKYGGSLKGESNEYKSKYAGTSGSDTTNYKESPNPTRIGEAIWETSTAGGGSTAWNKDYSGFPYTTIPFFIRGGFWNWTTGSGSFAFARYNGYCIFNVSFRPVLSKE